MIHLTGLCHRETGWHSPVSKIRDHIRSSQNKRGCLKTMSIDIIFRQPLLDCIRYLFAVNSENQINIHYCVQMIQSELYFSGRMLESFTSTWHSGEQMVKKSNFTPNVNNSN